MCLPLNRNLGGQITPDDKYEYKDSEYLMEGQVRHIL